MDAYDAVVTKLDVKEFDSKPVPKDVKLKILEAARLTGSGINSQHWRFILVQEPKNLRQLADDSATGKWVQGANFAVVVLTDPKFGFHLIDAGRVTQDMQVAAWGFGVASRLYTGFDRSKMTKDFAIPSNLEVSIIVGFGYPARKITGKIKDRKSLEDLVFLEKYSNKLERSKIM
jgi:nitroreductase